MEAFAIVFVFVVAVAAMFSAWVGTLNRSPVEVAEELDQLVKFRELLQEKAERARQENWDSNMLDRIAYQLDEVECRIARMSNPR